MRWKLAMAMLVTAAPLALRAQDSAVFVEDDIWKMYTTPQVQLTELGNESASIGSLSIGTILNDQWRFGVQFGALLGDVGARGGSGTVNLDRWNCWELGADFGYILHATELVHLDFGLFAGTAKLEADDVSGYGDHTDEAFLVIPSVNACLNLHETWEVGVGVAWRQYDGVGLLGLDDGDASDLALSIFARATEF